MIRQTGQKKAKTKHNTKRMQTGQNKEEKKEREKKVIFKYAEWLIVNRMS